MEHGTGVHGSGFGSNFSRGTYGARRDPAGQRNEYGRLRGSNSVSGFSGCSIPVGDDSGVLECYSDVSMELTVETPRKSLWMDTLEMSSPCSELMEEFTHVKFFGSVEDRNGKEN